MTRWVLCDIAHHHLLSIIFHFRLLLGCSYRWALYDLARHPAVQQRIAQELEAAGLLQVSTLLVQ
jgi:hypothetical protein